MHLKIIPSWQIKFIRSVNVIVNLNPDFAFATLGLRFESCGGNLESAANILRAQVNSASCPQRDGKWVIAYELLGKGL